MAQSVELERYAWTEDDSVVMYCLTYVEGVSAVDVLRFLEADVMPVVMGPEQVAIEAARRRRRGVRVATVGHWAVLVELASSLGNMPETLERLSMGSRALCVLQTGAGMDLVSYYERGVLMCQFEPTLPRVRRGTDPDRFLSDMKAVGIDPDAPEGFLTPTLAAVAFAERVTGVGADERLVLERELPAGLAGYRVVTQ